MPKVKDYAVDGFRQSTPETLAELLCPLADATQRQYLEEFRVEFEKCGHGETDLTKRYTSTWPAEQQLWMIKHHTRKYWEGLPPFAQAFFQGKFQMAADKGRLDDMPEQLLRLFVRGEMTVSGQDADDYRSR